MEIKTAMEIEAAMGTETEIDRDRGVNVNR